jgi:NaMN:DMB phosphoribosyltransferase
MIGGTGTALAIAAQKEDKTWGKVTNAQSVEKSGKEHTVKPARERKKRKNLESDYLYDFL